MIDLLPMWPEARRKGLRLLGDIESADQRLGGRARQAIGEGLARCSRPPVTLGPPHLRLRSGLLSAIGDWCHAHRGSPYG
jgi:hypothetical protein